MKISKRILPILLLGAALSAGAAEMNLYVDSAPNVYGSPNYDGWWANAQQTAAAGTFVNMGNSVVPSNVGTTDFDIRDVVVYSFGDLGRRLHFVYWIPGESIGSLTAKNFQIAMDYTWDGVTYDFYNENYGATWLTPTRWIDFNGGVVGTIGTAGFAWWGAYGVNTQEALDADLAAWDPAQGDITFHVKMDGAASSLTAHHGVPDGGLSVILLGTAIATLGLFRRIRQ
jgi:hypothetical protein